MPYIVTTKQLAGPGVQALPRTNPTVSRRAVATLDKAICECRETINRLRIADTLGPKNAKNNDRWLPWVGRAWSLGSESGGTIGPLPDGTEIEVMPTLSWGGAPIGMVRWLREDQGWSIPTDTTEEQAMEMFNSEKVPA